MTASPAYLTRSPLRESFGFKWEAKGVKITTVENDYFLRNDKHGKKSVNSLACLLFIRQLPEKNCKSENNYVAKAPRCGLKLDQRESHDQ